jgi:hypothetical protein
MDTIVAYACERCGAERTLRVPHGVRNMAIRNNATKCRVCGAWVVMPDVNVSRQGVISVIGGRILQSLSALSEEKLADLMQAATAALREASAAQAQAAAAYESVRSRAPDLPAAKPGTSPETYKWILQQVLHVLSILIAWYAAERGASREPCPPPPSVTNNITIQSPPVSVEVDVFVAPPQSHAPDAVDAGTKDAGPTK